MVVLEAEGASDKLYVPSFHKSALGIGLRLPKLFPDEVALRAIVSVVAGIVKLIPKAPGPYHAALSDLPPPL